MRVTASETTAAKIMFCRRVPIYKIAEALDRDKTTVRRMLNLGRKPTRPAYMPTLEDIAAATAEIRRDWSETEYHWRAGLLPYRSERENRPCEIQEFVFSQHRNGAAM